MECCIEYQFGSLVQTQHLLTDCLSMCTCLCNCIVLFTVAGSNNGSCISTAEGSSLIRLGNTIVVCGVKGVSTSPRNGKCLSVHYFQSFSPLPSDGKFFFYFLKGSEFSLSINGSTDWLACMYLPFFSWCIVIRWLLSGMEVTLFMVRVWYMNDSGTGS